MFTKKIANIKRTVEPLQTVLRPRLCWWLMALFAINVLGSGSSAIAAQPPFVPPPANAPAKAGQNSAQSPTEKKTAQSKSGRKKDQIEIPAPQNITLETKDRVNLACTYFPPPQDPEKPDGKQVVPFILLHDWDGDRNDLLPFASFLQRLGCAAIVPDLRGHGDSKTVIGTTVTLDYEKFRKAELASVLNDIEACKKYLVQRNNLAELNIDMLNVVAVGESCVLAIQWTLNDWYLYPNVGPIKQSQDVKSLTMIAPRRKLSGLSILPSVKHPLFAGRTGKNLPTLIMWASGNSVDSETGMSLYEIMKKGRPDLEEIKEESERLKAETLFSAAIPRTADTGSDLIRRPPSMVVWEYIARFVASQVMANEADYPWQDRERK